MAAAVDRHGVEDDEHQEHGQQLAEAEVLAARRAVEDERQAAADEQAEEPDRTGGGSSVHTLKDLGSSSGRASDLRFCGGAQGLRVASDALVL
ncbi:hypothetical protein [Streptomyces canus]|uniref:hypothetical protein n=1 Tax=Streptomyces canus TaxID=58343 RepID=UPI002E332D4E|nr:hypothetical protein [Streptomyces canus]